MYRVGYILMATGLAGALVQQQRERSLTIHELDEPDEIELSEKGHSASPCENLSGKWVNELGSQVDLQESSEGALTGQYRTAVELGHGSSGGPCNTLSGTKAANKLLSFKVFWKGNTSATTWIGQCYDICNVTGHNPHGPVLKTTWILTSLMKSCDDSWAAYRVGQDTFTKVNDVKEQ